MAGNQHVPPPQSPPKTPQNESGDKLDRSLNWNPKFSLPPPTESTPRDTPLDEKTSFHITSNDPPAEGSGGADARRNGRGRQSRRRKRSGSKSSSGSGGSQKSIENKKTRADGVHKKHVRKDYGSYNATQPEPNSRKYRETSPSKIDGIPKPKPEADLASFAENNKGNVWFDHGMAAKIKALSLQSPSRVSKNRKSPTRSATRSPVKSKSRSPTKNIGRSPANNRSRSPTKRIGRSPAKSKSRSPTKSIRRGGKNFEEDSPSLQLEASSETEDISEVASLSAESQGQIGRSGNFNSTLVEEEAQIDQSEETLDPTLPDEEALIDQSEEIFNFTLPDEDAQIDRREETLNLTQSPDPAPLPSYNTHTNRSENSSTPHQAQQLFNWVYWRQRQREARQRLRQRKYGTQMIGEIAPRIRSDDYHGPRERSYPPTSRPLQNRHSGPAPRTNRPESGPWRRPHRMQESSVYPPTSRPHQNRHSGSVPQTNPESGPSRESQGMQELSVYPSSVTLNQQEPFWIQNQNIGQGQYPVPGVSLINQQPFWIQNQGIQDLGHGQHQPPGVPLINQRPWIQDQNPGHGQHQAPVVPSINRQPFWIQNQEIQDLGYGQNQPHGLPLMNQQPVAFGNQVPLNGTSSVMHGHQNLGYGQNQAALAAIGQQPNMHNGIGHYPLPAIPYNQYHHAHTAIPDNNAPSRPDRAVEILNETLAGKTPEEQMAAEHKRSEVIAEKMKPADSDVGASKNCHWK